MKKLAFGELKLAIAAFAILFVFLTVNNFSNECSTKVVNNRIVSGTAENLQTDEDNIFHLINAERRKNNLSNFNWDDQLSEMARGYSEQMARENFFDHFDPNGADIVIRAKKAQLKHWSKIGENLFSIQGMRNFDAFAVKNWMASPTHRQNILDADFNTAAIGIARSSNGEIFVTQVFIRR